jgi:hypothetical protein
MFWKKSQKVKQENFIPFIMERPVLIVKVAYNIQCILTSVLVFICNFNAVVSTNYEVWYYALHISSALKVCS